MEYVNIKTQHLKTALKSEGKTMRFFNNKLGKNRSFLSNVLTGSDKITRDELQVVADGLNTTMDYLLGLTDDPNPPTSTLADEAETHEEKLLQLLMEKLPEISEEAKNALEKLLSMPTEDLERTVKAVSALIG